MGFFKKLTALRVPKRLYNENGHRKWAVLGSFYVKQLVKATLLLFVGYLPFNAVKTLLVNLSVSMGNVNSKTVIILITSTILYSVLSAVLFAMSIYGILFKMKWNYCDYMDEKRRKKASSAKYFTIDNAKKVETKKKLKIRDFYNANKNNNEPNAPMKKLTEEQNAKAKKIENAKRKAIQSKSKSHKGRK